MIRPSRGLIVALCCLICLPSCIKALRTAVIGATGGVGQLVCEKLVLKGREVFALGRERQKLSDCSRLAGCEKVQVSTVDIDSLANVLEKCDDVIINVGTSAFPSNAWKDNNNPKTACLESVVDILKAVEKVKNMSPAKIQSVAMVSSIGVDRTDKFPFKILNSFKVLDMKKQAENILLSRSAELNYKAIVVRPGRLVGAPYTNNDVATLLQTVQANNNRNLQFSRQDDVQGDVDRSDVAESLLRIMDVPSSQRGNVVYSLVNTKGPSPQEQDWDKLIATIL